MPVLESVAPRRQNGDRPKGTNKVQIPNGTRAATIVDVYIFNVTNDKERAYTTEVTGERNVRVKVQLDKRADVILAKTFRLYLGKKAAFAQFLQGITGIEAGSDAMRAFNTDDLLSERYKSVLVHTEYKEPYTNILSIMPRPRDEDDLEQVPAHTPREPEPAPINGADVKTRVLALLNDNRLLRHERERAIKAATGSTQLRSITTPTLALAVIANLEAKLKASESEIPF